MSISLILMMFAFCLFTIEAVRSKSLVAAGLSCWALSILLGGVVLHR